MKTKAMPIAVAQGPGDAPSRGGAASTRSARSRPVVRRGFAAAESMDAIEWYVIEVEKYNHDPLESVRLSIEQLRSWGKA